MVNCGREEYVRTYFSAMRKQIWFQASDRHTLLPAFTHLHLYCCNCFLNYRICSLKIFAIKFWCFLKGNWGVHFGQQRCKNQEERKYLQYKWRICCLLWPCFDRISQEEEIPTGKLPHSGPFCTSNLFLFFSELNSKWFYSTSPQVSVDFCTSYLPPPFPFLHVKDETQRSCGEDWVKTNVEWKEILS